MYRYKSLEGEYFCNKDFAKKYDSAYDLCIEVFSPCFLSSPFCFSCRSLTSCLFKVSKGLRRMREISVDSKNPAQQGEVTIFLGCILK